MKAYSPIDKGLMAFAIERQSIYDEARYDWAEEIGRPVPKRRKQVKPPPGSLELEDEELG